MQSLNQKSAYYYHLKKKVQLIHSEITLIQVETVHIRKENTDKSENHERFSKKYKDKNLKNK